MIRTSLVVLALVVSASAQPIFELQSVGAFPVLPSVDIEGVGAVNNAGALNASVRGSVGCGLPGIGSIQYAHLLATGDSLGSIIVPAGGPIPRAAALLFGTEIRIPIPPTANGVSFTWEFFDAESSTTYNDAFEVSVVDAMGNRIGNPLVYCDVAAAIAASAGVICGDPTGLATGTNEIGNSPALGGVLNGPQVTQIMLLPLPLPPGAAIAVMCVNSSDNAVASSAVVDDFIFVNNAPAWTFIQGGGAGTAFNIAFTNCTPNATFFMPVTFNAPGAFPNGWCLGVDIDMTLLMIELDFGIPFLGTTNSNGDFFMSVPPGILAPGTQLHAAAGFFNPGLGLRFLPRAATIL